MARNLNVMNNGPSAPLSLPEGDPPTSVLESNKLSQKVLSPNSDSDEDCDVPPDLPQNVPFKELNSILFKHHQKNYNTSIPSSQKSSIIGKEIWQSIIQNTGAKTSNQGENYSYLNNFDISSIMNLSFEQRAKYFNEKYKTNSNINKIAYETEETLKCTFKPKNHNRSKSACGTSFENFLKTQHEFEEEKQRKLDEKLKEKYLSERENITFIPEINENSTKIYSKRFMQKEADKIPVHKRLHSSDNYRKRKAEILEQEKKTENLLLKGSQTARKKLNKSVCSTAHIPNRHSREQVKKSLILENTPSKNTIQTKKINNLVSQKINKDLLLITYDIVGNIMLPIKYPEFVKILDKFGMLQDNGELPNEKKLLQEMWNEINGVNTENEGISLGKLNEFVHEILKTDKEGCDLRIHKKYYQFYLNRLVIKKQIIEEPEYSYRPQLTKNTLRLAGKSQERTKAKLTSNQKLISVENIMEAITKEKASKFDKIKQQFEEKSIKECTFKPKILNHRRDSSRDKFSELYNLSKRPKIPPKCKKPCEIEAPETYRQKTYRSRKAGENIKPIIPLKGVDNVVNRLTKARRVFF